MRLSRHLTALALAVPFVLLPAAPAAAACTVSVTLPNYEPASLTVAPGTTVTWCWTGDNHSVTGNGGGFDSHPACTAQATASCGQTGYQVSRQISATFAYHCKVHSGMQGQIVVAQPSPTATTPSPTPSRTTAPPTRTPSPTPTVRPTTPSPTPTRTPTPTPTPTTAAPLPPTSAPVTTSPAPLDPPPAKPNTGVAVGVGLLVAAAALGGATVLWLRGRGA